MKEIELSKLLKLLLKNIITILLSGVLCAAIAFGYCSLIAKPIYRTTASILVNNGGLSADFNNSNSISTGTISASLQLVTTCVDILKSDVIYKKLASALESDRDFSELRSHFSISARSENSLLIDISVTASSPKEAKRLANVFIEIIPNYIKSTLPPTDVKIMATASKANQVAPRTMFLTANMFIIGIIFSFAVFFIIDLVKNTIESETDFKMRYNIPLLGSVPFFENKTPGGKRNGNAQ